MPKKVFWPVALVVMGFIIIASNLDLLPQAFSDLWPIILVVVGLGGLITADKDEWMCCKTKTTAKKPVKKAASRKTAKKR